MCDVTFRHGFGRAGCVAVGFVLAENRSMTYEDAVNHVNTRRPVLPHVGLRDAIYRIYPRTWAPWLAASDSSSTVFSCDVVPEPEVVPALEVKNELPTERGSKTAVAAGSKTSVRASPQPSNQGLAKTADKKGNESARSLKSVSPSPSPSAGKVHSSTKIAAEAPKTEKPKDAAKGKSRKL